MRAFVEAAFLHGIMLGERFGPDLAKYRAVLGIPEPSALVAVAAFLPSPASPHPDDEMRDPPRAVSGATVRYKTKAFAGPLVAGHALGAAARAGCRGRGELPGGFPGGRRAVARTPTWRRAPPVGVRRARGPSRTSALPGRRPWRACSAAACMEPRTPRERPFDLDDAFLEALLAGSPERARMSLERLVEPLREVPFLQAAERYRLIALFGSALRMLARGGLIGREEVSAMMDMEDLRTAEAGPAFALAVLARFSRLAGSVGRAPRWSPLVSRAIAFVGENYDRQMTLESTASSLGISPNRLSRLFSEETGTGFSDYLIEYRIDKAKELLMIPGASIKHVSISCGYPDPNYFSRLFKKVTGLTPSTFSSGSPEADDGNG